MYAKMIYSKMISDSDYLNQYVKLTKFLEL